MLELPGEHATDVAWFPSVALSDAVLHIDPGRLLRQRHQAVPVEKPDQAHVVDPGERSLAVTAEQVVGIPAKRGGL